MEWERREPRRARQLQRRPRRRAARPAPAGRAVQRDAAPGRSERRRDRGVRGDTLADQRHLRALPAGREDEARGDDQEQQDVLPAVGHHPRGESPGDSRSPRGGDAAAAADHAGRPRRQRAARGAGEIRRLVPRGRR